MNSHEQDLKLIEKIADETDKVITRILDDDIQYEVSDLIKEQVVADAIVGLSKRIAKLEEAAKGKEDKEDEESDEEQCQCEDCSLERAMKNFVAVMDALDSQKR